MSDVNTMMAYGLSAEQAKAINDRATLGVDGLMALGFHSELAQIIVNGATTEQLMALGMSAELAKAVKAVIG
jgi:hypothetical protein